MPTELTDAFLAAIGREWAVPADQPRRLEGGEESAAYRVGDVVVRVAPAWRDPGELEWCYRVALAMAARVPEVVAPIGARDGLLVKTLAGHPISLWPYVEGDQADPHDPAQQRQAADLLARLHLAAIDLGSRRPRPMVSRPEGYGEQHPDTVETDLQEWVRRFCQVRPRFVAHGDFYRGNLLAVGSRLVALLDWDEVDLRPLEQELAWAAAEWAGLRAAPGWGGVDQFVATYHAHGGPAGLIDRTACAQLIRHRIQSEMDYIWATQGTDAPKNEDDAIYLEQQRRLFEWLRP